MNALNHLLFLAWPLLWIIFVLTVWDAAHDHRENRERVKNSIGREKRKAIFKHVRSWAIPILLFIAAVIAQIGSDLDDQKIGDLNQRINDANTLAMQLEKGQKPRTLTPKQEAAIVSQLSGQASGSVFFEIDNQSDDAMSYGNSIAIALSKAGFKIIPNCASISGEIQRGVAVYSHNAPDEQVKNILSALVNNGVQATGELPTGAVIGTGMGFQPSDIFVIIRVGKKIPTY